MKQRKCSLCVGCLIGVPAIAPIASTTRAAETEAYGFVVYLDAGRLERVDY